MHEGGLVVENPERKNFGFEILIVLSICRLALEIAINTHAQMLVRRAEKKRFPAAKTNFALSSHKSESRFRKKPDIRWYNHQRSNYCTE